MTDIKIARIEDALDRPTANAIVVRKGGSVAFASMGEVMEMAKLMSLSRQAIPKDLRESPGLCLGVIMQAIAWEMEPFAVARQAFVINDTVCYGSQLLHAVVEARAPLQRRLRCTYSGEGPERQCTVSALLNGESEPHEYTTPKVKDIPIKNSPLWKWDVDQQLFYFASRAWARKWVPDVLMGVYAPDEAKYAGENARTFERVENPLGPDDPDAVVPPKQLRDEDVDTFRCGCTYLRGTVPAQLLVSCKKHAPCGTLTHDDTTSGKDLPEGVAIEPQAAEARGEAAGASEAEAAVEQPAAPETAQARPARKPQAKEPKPEPPKNPEAVMPPPTPSRWGGEQYLCYLREWTAAAVAAKVPAAYVTERGKREMSLRNNLGTVLTTVERAEVASILQAAADKCQ